MRLGVNARFYGVPVWGVQRFAREVCARICTPLSAEADAEGSAHERVDGVDLKVFLPAGVEAPPGCPESALVRGHLPGHVWEQVELPWLSRRARCDALLHISGTGPAWGGPNVVAVHDVFPATNPEWFAPAFVLWYRAVVGRAAARAAAVLAPSAWARRQIVDTLGVPARRVHVVQQGVAPFSRPAPAHEVARVRERLGLPPLYLLAAGGDDRRKNVEFLVRTLALWKEREGRAPPLVVVGSHRARVHGHRRAGPVREGGAEVLRVGYVGDRELRALYTGARVFCFPSLGEGFGRPPLEAMGCGTPAVAADYGPAREVLGEAAAIVSLDPEAWIQEIASLLDEGARRRERVREGFRHVGRLSWRRAADGVLGACRAAARNGTPAEERGR